MGSKRFFSLILISGAIHIAAVLGIGWNQAVLPASVSSGRLQVSLARFPSALKDHSTTETTASISTTVQETKTLSDSLVERVERPTVRQLVTIGNAETTVQPLAQREKRMPTSTSLTDPEASTDSSGVVDSTGPSAVQRVDMRLVAAERLEKARSSQPNNPSTTPVTAVHLDSGIRPIVGQFSDELVEKGGAETGAATAQQQEYGQSADYASAGRQLLAALQDHFSYPLRARRKGWEGDVLLGVDLDEGGTIADVRLLASSGYGTLDRAALASMRAVGALERALANRLTVEVPVRYRLVN